MAMIKLAEKRWTYTLYRSNEYYILSVVCGGVGLFELNILLSNAHGAEASAEPGFLARLAAEIANDPEKYSGQTIPIYVHYT
jgi:hypothetical protein